MYSQQLGKAQASLPQLDGELQANTFLLQNRLRECQGWNDRHEYIVHALRDEIPSQLMLPEQYWILEQAPTPIGMQTCKGQRPTSIDICNLIVTVRGSQRLMCVSVMAVLLATAGKPVGAVWTQPNVHRMCIAQNQFHVGSECLLLHSGMLLIFTELVQAGLAIVIKTQHGIHDDSSIIFTCKPFKALSSTA